MRISRFHLCIIYSNRKIKAEIHFRKEFGVLGVKILKAKNTEIYLVYIIKKSLSLSYELLQVGFALLVFTFVHIQTALNPKVNLGTLPHATFSGLSSSSSLRIFHFLCAQKVHETLGRLLFSAFTMPP